MIFLDSIELPNRRTIAHSKTCEPDASGQIKPGKHSDSDMKLENCRGVKNFYDRC